jgi:hypothetical protein
MSQHHIGWNRSDDSHAPLSALATSPHETMTLERPSLVEMTREQYEGLLNRALRRSHRED